MCGLIGIAAVRPCPDCSWLVAGRDAMVHRGPDDAGVWWSDDRRVGLAQRRLAIIDLSPLGHQPMRDEARGLTLVFNGEIYNFRELRGELEKQGFSFRSNSDTEVLLAAYASWGESCLARINGMFALAIHDARQQKLFLARDRAGEKPLFYRVVDGGLTFASELKALLADPHAPRRIDRAALDCYLALGFVPAAHCILDGYRKLPPAHALSFDLRSGTPRVWRYWSAPEPPANDYGDTLDENGLLDELEALLEDAVGRQLVADVPVGVLLSGGVDSSLVTAMAVRRSRHVRTFTIGFPGQGAMDETPHARLIARHFGTEHTELMAEPATADLMPRLIRQFDEPMADSSMFPTWLVASLVRRYCTVALGGDGGDELFGGYPHYSRLLWLQQKSRYVPRWLRWAAAIQAERLIPPGFANRNVRTWMMAAGADLSCDLPMVGGLFDAATRRALLGQDPEYQPVVEKIRSEYVPETPDLLQRATRTDFVEYLPEDILVKVDRTSMLNSLEVRAPLLDHRLIEFAFGRIPSRLKATARDKKILLKRLAARVLPADFDRRRKQGFSIPLAEWLKAGPFRDLFWDTLSGPDVLFERRAITALLEDQSRGFNNAERLFALVQFELWRRYYGAAL